MRAIQITEFGGPEVLRVVDLADPQPVDGQLLVEVDAAGVNYADTHQTDNTYLAPQRLPLVPGAEVVGRVRQPGGARDGERVVALVAGGGGYAGMAAVHPRATFAVPDEIGDGEALALVLQGTTAWHLLRTSARMQPGECVVVHAAAGGVGTLAVQLAKQWGAGRVIATASTPDKRELALSLGADAAVDVSGRADAGDVREVLVGANHGKAVDIVLEMTGGHVFDGSLASLAPFGRLVTFGTASRRPGRDVPAAELVATSRAVIGFWLVHTLGLPAGLTTAMEELISLTHARRLRPVVGGTYPLGDVARAHQDLLERRSTGKLVLDVRA